MTNVTTVEMVNMMAKEAKAEGPESIAFFELFEHMDANVIHPKARSYKKELKGDVAEAVSMGYMLLVELVEKWQGTEKNFYTFFSHSYTNRIINLVEYVSRHKRSHNTSYTISLSEADKDSDEFANILEVTNEEQLKSFDTYDVENDGPSLSSLLEKFASVKPEQHGIVQIMENFTEETKQADKTKAYMEYYGVTEYTSAIQKKVSRARESFKKFLTDEGYAAI